MRLTIQTVGDAWLPGYFLGADEELKLELLKLLDHWRRILVAEIRANAPKDRGTLSRSIVGVVDRRLFEILIQSRLDWSLYQEYGTGIYSDFPGAPKQVIRPKHAKALKLVTMRVRNVRAVAAAPGEHVEIRPGKVRAGNVFIFRSFVRGSKPQHYAQEVLDARTPDIIESIEQLLERIGKKYGEA